MVVTNLLKGWVFLEHQQKIQWGMLVGLMYFSSKMVSVEAEMEAFLVRPLVAILDHQISEIY